MNRVPASLLLSGWLSLALTPLPAGAAEVWRSDQGSLAVDGRLQWIGVLENVPDDARWDDRTYLFLKQARLRVSGMAGDSRYNVEWANGGEEIVATGSGIALGLLDYSFDTPLAFGTRVRVGQFLVPYGRERMTDDGALAFGDRTVQNYGFAWNRDVGAALHGQAGSLAAAAAVMTGGGRDVPQRYLPERLGSPLLAVRAGWNANGDASALDPGGREGAGAAAYVNGLYLRDTQIGHSTVLNVRLTDKFMLINPSYNPYIARTPLVRGIVRQAGVDAVVRAPAGGWMVGAEVEANYADFANEYGRLLIKGARIQAGASRGALDVNLRYAVLLPDKSVGYLYAPGKVVQIGGDQAIEEITPAVTWRFRPHVTVIADAPLLLSALVFKEKGVGSYVGSEQPDQVTNAKPATGSLVRAFVPQARLLLQFTF